MRLTIPLTGTILAEGSVWGAGDLVGDPADPIRPVDLDLGNVSWKMVDLDLANEVMIIEVSPGDTVPEPDLDDQGNQKVDDEPLSDAQGNPLVDGQGNPITQRNPLFRSRPATPQEQAGFLQAARTLVESRSGDELYAMSGRPRLKRPSQAPAPD